MVDEHRTRRGHGPWAAAEADADGTGHPRRHALGAFTNRQVAGAFARPRFNAPAFRQNDAVARTILTTLASLNAGSTEAEAVIG